jgi:CRP-like cAMP-binding protein
MNLWCAAVHYHNHLLSFLHSRCPDIVGHRARQLSFVHGDVIGEAGRAIEHVFFPSSGMISIVVELRDGGRVEAAMVGRRGAIGASVVFGGREHLNTSFAQLPGNGWSLAAADVIELANRDKEVRTVLFDNEQYLLAQAQQTAACNARHVIPQRLATWILRATDATGGDELTLTQEYLAQMLGVQRASVSMFAGSLQDKGLIFYRRGRVRVLDPHGLEQQACECHAALRRQHARLFEADIHQPA